MPVVLHKQKCLRGNKLVLECFAGPQTKPQLKVESETPDFDCLTFSADGHLWAATSDHKLEKYCCSSGRLLAIVDAMHRDTIQTLSAHSGASLLLTGGFDGLLKIWDVSRYACSPMS